MKLFGKRGKDGPGENPQVDPRSAFAVAPLPRHAGPPASSTPLADQLGHGGPGVTEGYVVLPRGLAEQMPLPWQRQAASVIAQFQHTHRSLPWPAYRVLPSREERLVDLDEEQLAEAGYVVEMDVNGELVYRERNGRKVADPEQKRVLVTCLDPVQPQRPAEPQPPGPPPPGAPARAPVPMNIGPQPKWDVVPSKAHPEPPTSPAAPTASPASSTASPASSTASPASSTASRASPTASTPPPPPPQPPLPPQPPEPKPPAPPVEQQPEPEPPPVQKPQPEQQAVDEDTPPRGVPRQDPADPIDWFAEPPAAEPESSVFGPSGDPIEEPYRYNR
jgi:hypothetical protein